MSNISDSAFDKTIGIEIQGWILDLSAEDFDAVLNKLELTADGTPFARVDRLYRRLRGDYTAADFIESENAENDVASRARREHKLRKVLESTKFSEETLAQIAMRQMENFKQQDESGFAPLANSSANTSNNAQNTTATTRQEAQRNKMDEAAQIQPVTAAVVTTTTCTYSTSVATSAQSHSTGSLPKTVFSTTDSQACQTDNVLCKLPDGTMYTVPRKIALELIKAQTLIIEKESENSALKQQMTDIASSTRLHAPTSHTKKPSKSVNFQDTFDLNYIETSEEINQGPSEQEQQEPSHNQQQRTMQLNANAPIFPAPSHQQRQTHFPAALPPPVRWQESGRGEHPSAPSNQSTQLLPDMSRAFVTAGDVGRTVRQWRVRFAGEKGESIEEFIQRVEECRRLAHISDADLLNALSELLSGVALHWCRHSRADWITWSDFCRAARRCYGVEQNFQQRLIAEAQARKQGRREPARDYIFCLLTIFSRLESPPSTQYQLDMLYANMLPSLRKLVPKEKVTSVDRLVQLAREAEELLEEERNFPAPLSPEQSVLPSVAYKEPEDKVRKSAKSASDRTHVNVASIADPSPQSLVETISKILDEKLKHLSAPFGNSQTRQTPARGSRWTRKRDATKRRNDSSDQGRVTIVEMVDDSDKKAQQVKARPARNRNRSNEAGPRARVYCFSCGWPGYLKSTCPECSGNEKRGE